MLATIIRSSTCAFTLLAIAPITFGQFTVERVVGDLNQPIYMTQAPGDNNSLYIVERADPGGQVGRILKYDQQAAIKSTFLDLAGSIQSDGGALSLAFHPDFQANGKFYVTLNDSAVNRLEEYQVVGVTPQFQRTLYEYNNLTNNFHTINWIGFRPNGNDDELFLTAGDGGAQANSGSFDPALIESLDSPYGKVLRFDLTADYSGGPAVDTTHTGIDVIAFGLRNPYRASFDKQTGDMFIGDVGFQTAEEINFIPASQFNSQSPTPIDFGWTSREGTIETPVSGVGGPGSAGDVDPIFDYAHNGDPLPHPSVIFGRSVTGGYVYRGPVPELQGRYFFGDFVTQDIYSGTFDFATNPQDYDGTNLTDIQNHTQLFEDASVMNNPDTWVTSFAEDNAGNLYVVDFGEGFFPPLGEGEIYRIVPAAEVTLTINRNTGEMVLNNLTATVANIEAISINSTVGAIEPSLLTPIAGNYDNSLNGDGSVDNNDAWQIISPAGSNTTFQEETTGDAGTLFVGVPVQLSAGGGWIRSPTEDLSLQITFDGGAVLNGNVVFVGNEGNKLSRSDLDFDGELETDDWAIFMANNETDLSGLSMAASYGRGDLDGDGDNDIDDFRIFKSDFIAANGVSAFEALLAVPEPTAALLSLTCWGLILAGRRQHRQTS